LPRDITWYVAPGNWIRRGFAMVIQPSTSIPHSFARNQADFAAWLVQVQQVLRAPAPGLVENVAIALLPATQAKIRHSVAARRSAKNQHLVRT
jgi:hypothetical protein